MKVLIFSTILVICLCAPSHTNPTPPHTKCKGGRVVCYFPNWTGARQDGSSYTVDNIDPSLCTHIIYSFAVLDPVTHLIKSQDPWLDQAPMENFRKFTSLKESHPDVKFLLALGGWLDSSFPKYSVLLASPVRISVFVAHAVTFLQEYGFDGLDVDYEYPTWDGHGHDAPDTDRRGFTDLLKQLSEAFKPLGLELTAAVPALKEIIDEGYEVAEISKYLDAVHLMAYDMHSSWDSQVFHHAPLYGEEEDPRTVHKSVGYWLRAGTPPDKLVLGIPTYGRSWTLATPDTAINSTASGTGAPGPVTEEAGYLAYHEICRNIREEGWTKVSDPTGSSGPYAFKDDQWVGYDDSAMAGVKARYILANHLGGAMFWDLPSDDFRGWCGEGASPVISTVSSIVKDQC